MEYLKQKDWYEKYHTYGENFLKIAENENKQDPIYLFTRMVIPTSLYNFLHILHQFEENEHILGINMKKIHDKLKRMDEIQFRKYIKVVIAFHTIHFFQKVKYDKNENIDVLEFEKKLLLKFNFNEEERKAYGRMKSLIQNDMKKAIVLNFQILLEYLELANEREFAKLITLCLDSTEKFHEGFAKGFVQWSEIEEEEEEKEESEYIHNYYDLLGVSIKADSKEIKKAYMKLAKEYHPDVYTGNDIDFALSMFKKGTEAYDILMDEEKRKEYDKKIKRFDNLFR